MPEVSLSNDRTPASRERPWGWLAVAALVIANVPLLLCMPLAADAVLYDLQAKTALTGGVLYRDIVEPNLPGIVWCHMVIRSFLGWSEAALKWVDLAVVTGIVALLVRHIGRARSSQTILAAFAFIAVGFYASTPEWVHCQRDIWLMLPALLAFTLRVKRVVDWERDSTRGFAWSAVAEGLLWGAAFWIKPYVAVPALAAIGMSALLMRMSERGWTAIILDLLAVVAGGAIVGGLGAAWLVATGMWSSFLEQMLEWNPVYFANGRSRWTVAQYLSLSRDLAPWCLVHVVALPVAIAVVWGAVKEARLLRSRIGSHCITPFASNGKSRASREVPEEARLFPLSAEQDPHGELALGSKTRASGLLLAALYLGWMFQAHFLQHPFHYCHTPTVFLAAALLAACWPRSESCRRVATLAFVVATATALWLAPCFDPARLAWWPDCIARGAAPDVKCALHHRNLPNWVELQPVVEYLKRQDLNDGELTAYNVFLVHLYPELGVRPSTRYVFLDVLMQVFHDRAGDIQAALAASPQRFVVCSLLENGMRPEDIAAAGPGVHQSLPAAFPPEHSREFPYCLPLVFRSGQYVVYRADQPLGELNTAPRPLAAAQR